MNGSANGAAPVSGGERGTEDGRLHVARASVIYAAPWALFVGMLGGHGDHGAEDQSTVQ